MAENHDRELNNAADAIRQLQGLVYSNERTNEKIAEIVKEAFAIEARVRALEGYAQSRAITEAREDERDKALRSEVAGLREEIKGFNSIGSKLFWNILSPVILATVAFILGGGLNLIKHP
jgi:hypothetical protein